MQSAGYHTAEEFLGLKGRSSRKFWIGFKSALRAEISHYMAPDEGVIGIGRAGNDPPYFRSNGASRTPMAVLRLTQEIEI
jgi:hypothetical protein